MSKVILVKPDIYPSKVFVCFGSLSECNLVDHISEDAIKNLEGLEYHAAKTVLFENGNIFLWIEERPDSPAGFGALAHEVFHAACFILQNIGVKFSSKSQEAYAYLIDYLYEQIYKGIEAQKIEENGSIDDGLL